MAQEGSRATQRPREAAAAASDALRGFKTTKQQQEQLNSILVSHQLIWHSHTSRLTLYIHVYEKMSAVSEQVHCCWETSAHTLSCLERKIMEIQRQESFLDFGNEPVRLLVSSTEASLSVISHGFFFQPRSSQRALFLTGRSPDVNGPLTFSSAAALRPRGGDIFKDWRWQRERREVEGIDQFHPLQLDERLVWSGVYRVANLLWDAPGGRKHEQKWNEYEYLIE